MEQKKNKRINYELGKKMNDNFAPDRKKILEGGKCINDSIKMGEKVKDSNYHVTHEWAKNW